MRGGLGKFTRARPVARSVDEEVEHTVTGQGRR